MAKVLKNATTGKLLSIANGGLIKGKTQFTQGYLSFTGNVLSVTIPNVEREPATIIIAVEKYDNVAPTTFSYVFDGTDYYAFYRNFSSFSYIKNSKYTKTYDSVNKTLTITISSNTYGLWIESLPYYYIITY